MGKIPMPTVSCPKDGNVLRFVKAASGARSLQCDCGYLWELNVLAGGLDQPLDKFSKSPETKKFYFTDSPIVWLFDRQKLIKERQKRGLSQKQLVIRSGLSQPSISAIETGSKTPKLQTLFVLASILGMHPCELMKDEVE